MDWSVRFFGVRSLLRSALTARAREDHPEARLLIIGNTLFDGLAAKAADIPFLAVCAFRYDCSTFQESEAIAVMDTLAEFYDVILLKMPWSDESIDLQEVWITAANIINISYCAR